MDGDGGVVGDSVRDHGTTADRLRAGYPQGDGMHIVKSEIETHNPWKWYADHVVSYLYEIYGSPETWLFAANNRSTMAECILDSVYSSRVRHAQVDSMIRRFTAWTLGEKICVTTSTRLIHVLRGDAGAPTVPETSVLPANRIAGRFKRDIAADLAWELAEAGVEECADFRELGPDEHEDLRARCLRIKGFGESGWVHLCLLAGSVVVSPTTAVRRFLAMDEYRVPDEDIVLILRYAAEMLELPYAALMRAVDLVSQRCRGTLLEDLDRLTCPEPPAA